MQQNRSFHPAPAKPDDVERRLSVLEERLAFAEHTLDDLGGVINAVQTQLDRLESEARRIESFVERLSTMRLGEDRPHEKPPHY